MEWADGLLAAAGAMEVVPFKVPGMPHQAAHVGNLADCPFAWSHVGGAQSAFQAAVLLLPRLVVWPPS